MIKTKISNDFINFEEADDIDAFVDFDFEDDDRFDSDHGYFSDFDLEYDDFG